MVQNQQGQGMIIGIKYEKKKKLVNWFKGIKQVEKFLIEPKYNLVT